MLKKRRAILVSCCLNNLYGSYATMQTFLKFNNEKTRKEKQKNSQDHHLIKHLKIFQKNV